ncbi:MAG: helix-turn-helix domain-containing protein [Candidatus Aadella gelida]|nr:helix-turn-helix domain-containing protein [Candidatus Aadella gelida]
MIYLILYGNKMEDIMSNINSIVDLGTVVKTKRKNMKLTQASLAALCNVGTRFISELENGKTTLEISKVFKVIQGLGFIIKIEERRIR